MGFNPAFGGGRFTILFVRSILRTNELWHERNHMLLFRLHNDRQNRIVMVADSTRFVAAMGILRTASFLWREVFRPIQANLELSIEDFIGFESTLSSSGLIHPNKYWEITAGRLSHPAQSSSDCL